MLLALLSLALIAVVLALPLISRQLGGWRKRQVARRAARTSPLDIPLYDPGRERRAEQRARELLRSCVNDEEWGMYRDLGFIRVTGQMFQKRRRSDRPDASGRRGAGSEAADGGRGSSTEGVLGSTAGGLSSTEGGLDPTEGGLDSTDSLDGAGGLLAPDVLDAHDDRDSAAGDGSDPRDVPSALDAGQG